MYKRRPFVKPVPLTTHPKRIALLVRWACQLIGAEWRAKQSNKSKLLARE